jgi:CheY-like chemotaxis protein
MGRGTVFRITLPGPLGTSEPPHRVSSGEATKGVRNKLVVVLDDDLTVLRATERLFEALGVEVYADHDPLRWLSVVTDLKRAPDLMLLDYQLGDQDCSLHLDLVKRKWSSQKRNVLVLTGSSQSAGLFNVSSVAPVLKKPLTDRKFEFILDVLAGLRELPEAGFVEVPDGY